MPWSAGAWRPQASQVQAGEGGIDRQHGPGWWLHPGTGGEPCYKARLYRIGKRTMESMRKACLALLKLFGWSSVLVWPPEPRGLILVYPHTSNWDFVIGVLFRVGNGLPAHWMGKDTMFKWPFAGLLRRLGGVPINRRQRTGVIDALLEEFRRRDWLWLAVAPEGTRSYTDHLKSGFYQIARTADLPIGLAYIDYGRRQIGIDTYVRMTGDEERDLETLRAYYADKRARVPRLAGPIRFRETTSA